MPNQPSSPTSFAAQSSSSSFLWRPLGISNFPLSSVLIFARLLRCWALPLLEVSVLFSFSWNLSVPPFPQVLRGSRKCWHRGGLPTPVLQPRLPRHQAGLKSPFVIKVLWGPLGIFSKGGEGVTTTIRWSCSLHRHRDPDSCTAFALIANVVLLSWR